MGRGDGRGAPVQLLGEVDVVLGLGRTDHEAAGSGLARCRGAPQEHGEHPVEPALSVRREPSVAADEAQIRGDVEVLGDCEPQVGADRSLLELVVEHVALLVVVAHRQEVGQVVGAARDAQVVVLDVAGAEHLPAGRDLLGVQVLADDLAADQTVVGRDASVRVVEPVAALADGQVDHGSAGRALAGDDLDDAVGRLGPVQSRRGGALDDLDALDLFGVDVVQPGRACAARGAGPVVGVDADPVDVDEGTRVRRSRAGSLGERPDPADEDVAAGADVAASDLHADAGHLAGQQLLEAGGGDLLDLGSDFERAHDVCNRPALLAPGRTGDDDLVEAEGFGREGEVLHHGLARGHGGLRAHGAHADALGAHLVDARRHVDEQVAPVLASEGAEPGTDEVDLHLAQRGARGRVGDLPGDVAGLLGRGRGDGEQPDA